jgi:hypothetical protein
MNYLLFTMVQYHSTLNRFKAASKQADQGPNAVGLPPYQGHPRAYRAFARIANSPPDTANTVDFCICHDSNCATRSGGCSPVGEHHIQFCSRCCECNARTYQASCFVRPDLCGVSTEYWVHAAAARRREGGCCKTAFRPP